MSEYATLLDSTDFSATSSGNIQNLGPFPGATTQEHDICMMFGYGNALAFAGATWPDPEDTRQWGFDGCTFGLGGGGFGWGIGEGHLMQERGDTIGDTSDILWGGNVSMGGILLTYTDIRLANFRPSPQLGTQQSNLATGTVSLPALANTCTGGKNIAWVVVYGTTSTLDVTWDATCTEVGVSNHSTGSLLIAEQRVSGTGDWPAISCSFTGGSTGTFQAVNIVRFAPLFRQDGDA